EPLGRAAGDDGHEVLVPDADPHLGHEPVDTQAHDPPSELVSGAQVEPGAVVPGFPAKDGLEVTLVEQPFPPDTPPGKLAGPRKSLDPLHVEVEIGSRLLGAQ